MFCGRHISAGLIKIRQPLLRTSVMCSENKNISNLCSNLKKSTIFNNKINLYGCMSTISQCSKALIHSGQSTYIDNDANTGDKPQELDLKAISKGDPQVEHKLKVLLLEMEVLRQEGHLVPEVSLMKPEDFEELLNLQSRSGRQKFLQFLFKKSKKQENQKLKKKRPKFEDIEKERPTEDDGTIHYGLQGNNIFLRFYESTINQMYNNRLIQAMQFGQKLIVDCGYEENMVKREIINCAKQIMFLFSDNRFHDDPFDLHLCNLKPNGILRDYLKRQIPTMDEPWFPLNIHQGSYLDLFPKDQLVYLTPHCRNEMVDYDHDAIYIIGGIVDKINKEPLSLAKAKKENLRMAKFPLDKYLQWGSGSGKSLTLNQCISILLDLKKTNDWKYALRHVPARKITNNQASIENHKRQISRFQKIWKPSYIFEDSEHQNRHVSQENKNILTGKFNRWKG